jgi:hypothetical protein
MAYSAKAEAILKLTGVSYDEWNSVMPLIRQRLKAWDFIGHQRVETFNRVLGKELLESPARHATRVAILVAVGEMEEPMHPDLTRKARKKNA